MIIINKKVKKKRKKASFGGSKVLDLTTWQSVENEDEERLFWGGGVLSRIMNKEIYINIYSIYYYK
jgi:hypothetical protein